MILVKPSYSILSIYGSTDEEYECNPLTLIELAGRTCYKSENNMTNKSHIDFTNMILKRGHESVLEHSAMTVKFICDRGVSHELVRHRLCAFSQESTRYVNYKGGCTFVIPPWCNITEGNYGIGNELRYTEVITGSHIDDTKKHWLKLMGACEISYINLLNFGWSPQQARSVLPNSTKTEIVVTANFREWRHIFRLRCSKAAHPQMRELMIPLLQDCKNRIPVIFDNIDN